MNKLLLIAAVVLAAAGIAYGVYRAYYLRGTEPTQCQLCSRPIHLATAFALVKDGKEVWCCCPRCALAWIDGRRFERATATDHASGEHVAAERCVYVEGADLMPCCAPNVMLGEAKAPMERCFDRCSPSLIAFALAAQARDFVQQHGGEVVSFEALLAEARR
ncbi:MAG: hypothetical protein U1E76_12185 [Planctomycetota bacterium]